MLQVVCATLFYRIGSQVLAVCGGQQVTKISKIGKLICGLYYKHMTIVNDDSSVIIKWSFKLIDAARGVVYDRHMFIAQPTGVCVLETFFQPSPNLK